MEKDEQAMRAQTMNQFAMIWNYNAHVEHQYNYDGRCMDGNKYHYQEENSPAFHLLLHLVEEMKPTGKPKLILLPYKAALLAKALPLWDCRTFNRKMGTNVSPASFSNWVNGTQGCEYKDEEIDSYVDQFVALR